MTTTRLALDKGIARLETTTVGPRMADDRTAWDEVARLLMTASGGRRLTGTPIAASYLEATAVAADLDQLADELDDQLLALT